MNMKRAIATALIAFASLLVITSCKKKQGVKPDYSIKLAADTMTVRAGLTGQISSTNYTISQLTLTSSDTTIATIDNAGVITALKAGQVTINVKNTEHNVSTTFSLKVTNGKFTDVGIGADGSMYLVGADQLAGTTGYRVYKYVNGEVHKLPDCGAVKIAVSPEGVPWVVNYQNQVLTYAAGAWQLKQGLATDIAIGANGSIFAISTIAYSPTGGNTVLKWNGSGFDTMTDCSGIHIAVDPNGTPWVANKSNVVYQYSGNITWNVVSGVNAKDIAIGANGLVCVTAVLPGVLGDNLPIYRYSSGNWTQVNAAYGASLAVGPTGTIWWLDATSGTLLTQ
ncbi:MAG: Ig-like domain-containing protein [Bacteroidetes bacterium]|nr:Ig-like domain-containing protein [Bacteroidota bacterium]